MKSAIGWHQSRYSSLKEDRSQKQLRFLHRAKLSLGVHLDPAIESEPREDAVVQGGSTADNRIGSVLQISLTFA